MEFDDRNTGDIDAAFEDGSFLDTAFDTAFAENASYELPEQKPQSYSAQSKDISFAVSLRPGDWSTFCEKAGVTDEKSAVEAILIELDIPRLIKGITEVCGERALKNMQHIEIDLHPESDGACASFAAELKDFSFSIVNGAYQPVFKAMQFTGEAHINLPILKAADRNPKAIAALKETIVEEVLHIIMPNTPRNEMIDEGLAAVAINLMIKKGYLSQDRYVSGIRLISGFETSGINPGEHRTAHNNAAHSLIGEGGAVLLSHCLGGMETEIFKNFKCIFDICAQRNNNVIIYDDWMKQVDSLIPGFRQRFETHQLSKPISDGEKIAFNMRGVHEDPEFCQGFLHAFNYKGNVNFGLPKFTLPNNIEPLLQHFNLEPGNAEYLSLFIEIEPIDKSSPAGLMETNAHGGEVSLFPRALGRHLSKFPDNETAMGLLGKYVKISVSTDNNNYYTVGDKFFVSNPKLSN